MSETAERHNAWVERVLGVPVSPQSRARLADEEAALRQHEEREDREGYGEGFKPFDIRGIHANLSTALTEGRLVTADEWNAAATGPDAAERKKLLDDRDGMKARLATLGAARTEERRLNAEAERLGQPAKSIKEAIDRLANVKEGPPLHAHGSVGIPPADFDAQIAAASSKWYAVLTMRRAVEKVAPDSPACKACAAWDAYWWDMKAGLTKAKAGTMAGFDPDLIPKPGAPPDLTGLAGAEITKAQSGITQHQPYAAPAVPPPVPANVPAASYGGEIAAADKKWAAMLGAQSKFEEIKTRTKEQDEALVLVKSWKSYWYNMREAIKKARDLKAPDFDPVSIVAPAQKPDLSTLKQAAEPAKKSGEDALAKHREAAIKPVVQDMQACLTTLDAPENNPERVEVGLWLDVLGKVNDQVGGGTPTRAQVADKAKALDELQAALFGWNDRRTRQNLPPCAEAVALADMLQIEHRKLIDEVVKQKLPLPVPNPDSMSPAEEKAMQAGWAKLRDGTGTVKVPAAPAGTNTTQAQADQFRSETLANFARLLGAPSGRKLLRDLEGSGKDITVEAGTSAACTITGTVTGGARPRLPTGKVPTTDEEARSNKGTGSGSSVSMVLGAKDSDVALNTEAGSPLHAPRFIAFGHELVHALHNARGINRANMTLTDDPVWSNPEELQTIRKGGLSEQTLRNQYGLSAERFGHGQRDPDGAVAASYTAELDALDLPPSTDTHGFDDFDSWPPRLRKAVGEASPRLQGPLPTGWAANQLNAEQIRLVIDRKLPARLKALGWSPLELAPPGSGERLDQVLAAGKAHPRSPQGLRYRHLGGDAALTALQGFKAKTHVAVSEWDDASWPSKLRALEAAESWLSAFGDVKGGEFDTIAKAGKLPQKLDKMAEAMQKAGTPATDPAAAEADGFSARGGLAAMDAIGQLNTVLGTSLPVPASPLSAMSAALDKAEAWLGRLAGEVDKLPVKDNNELTAVISSSVGGGGPLSSKLGDVVMCLRRGRAVDPGFLSAAIGDANKVL